MARQAKLVRKLQEIVRGVKRRTRGDRLKMDLSEEVMADSPGVLAWVRGHERRLDRDFGYDVVANHEPFMAVDLIAETFDRHDFDDTAAEDFGVRMVLASGLVAALGLRPKDKVQVLEGEYEGMVLEIVSVDASADELRFADDAAKTSETDIAATARLSSAT